MSRWLEAGRNTDAFLDPAWHYWTMAAEPRVDQVPELCSLGFEGTKGRQPLEADTSVTGSFLKLWAFVKPLFLSSAISG